MPTKAYTFLFALFLLLPLAFGEQGKPSNIGTFIRQPGHYSLDDKGSNITIRQESTGKWSLKTVWEDGQGTSISDSPDILHQSGWFIYVESRNRIWINDGNGHLFFTGLEGNKQTSGMSSEIYATCPKIVRDAVPAKAIESKKP